MGKTKKKLQSPARSEWTLHSALKCKEERGKVAGTGFTVCALKSRRIRVSSLFHAPVLCHMQHTISKALWHCWTPSPLGNAVSDSLQVFIYSLCRHDAVLNSGKQLNTFRRVALLQRNCRNVCQVGLWQWLTKCGPRDLAKGSERFLSFCCKLEGKILYLVILHIL